MGEINVPLHHIQLESDFITGSVVVGIQPALPIEGIALLVGIDRAEGKVVSSTGPSKVKDPNSTSDTGKGIQAHPTFAVTRDMKRKKQKSIEAQASWPTYLKASPLRLQQ